MIRLSDESSRMAKRKRRIIQGIRLRILEAPYDVDYFARKHEISPEQARELMRKLGRDREKLNKAAAELFRG
jgi:hypothetical protein